MPSRQGEASSALEDAASPFERTVNGLGPSPDPHVIRLAAEKELALAALVHWRMTQVSIAHLRQLIRTLSYAVSTHAADELEDDHLTILDLENVVLSGQIVERQRNRGTRETKYVIQGGTLDGTAAEVVAKVGHSGKLFIITVCVV